MAIVTVDNQTFDTAFIDQYLQRPASDPVRIAVEKWQAEQEAKVRKIQRGAAPKTKRTDAKAEGIKKSEEIVAAGRAKAEAELTAKERAANEKARKAGAALPYPTTTAVTVRQAGIPGAGRGTTPLPQGPGLGGRDVITTTEEIPETPPKPPSDVPADTPQGDLSSASTDTAEAADKKKIVNNVNDSADLEKLGINRAVLRYMKENYPDDYAKIKRLIDNTLSDKDLTQNEIDRISVEFKKSEYYKKSTVEKYRTEIGSYFITNGLDTVTNSALIDQLTSDVYLKKVITSDVAEAQIRKLAVERLGLATSQDTNKQRIANAMINGGQTFLQAAAPYVQAYATTLEIPASEFDPLSDNAFLNAFNGSTSFADFQIKVKSDPRYAMSMKGRQEMDQAKLNLQRLTRALGLGYNPQQLESQALNVVAGKTTFEQIEYSLRSIAGEAFPAFKDRILAGDTIENIAAPYVRSMTNILEIPESAIDLSNPSNEIRKALIGDGTNFKPLWQFEQELFKDARWQFTSNARDTVDRVSMDILQRFGVMG